MPSITLKLHSPFSCDKGVRSARIVVEAEVVRVWDQVAGYFTTCHNLTPSQEARCRAAWKKAGGK